MGRAAKTKTDGLGGKPLPRTLTPEARENQLISLAYDLVEQRMRDGSASAMEVVHFLKLGSQKDKLEREIMTEQKKLVSAKTDAYETGKRLEGLYADAIDAMKTYSGAKNDETIELQ